MKRVLENIYYSFPVQLVLLHFKKHQIMLLLWGFLFAIITRNLATSFGIPFLFLDPEYLGNVNFLSFMINGIGLGAFIMSWHITSYILHSFRFPFLATLHIPFAKFCLNNSVIPALFLIFYIYNVIEFQTNVEFTSGLQQLGFIAGLFTGMGIISALIFTYFFNTNKNVFTLFGIRLSDQIGEDEVPRKSRWVEAENKGKIWPVRFYITIRLKAMRVRSIQHYKPHHIKEVFQQNHANALIIEMITITILLILGYFVENRFFRIPAATSLLLVTSIGVMLLSAFSYWLRGWRTTAFIGILLFINYMLNLNYFDNNSQAYGLDYSIAGPEYKVKTLVDYSSREKILQDIDNTQVILSNWKRKFAKKDKKPKLVILNSSGGGLRAAVWTTRTLQAVDSVLEDPIMDHTVMMTGASAGVIGMAYYRELYLAMNSGKNVRPEDKEWFDRMSQDILNPLTFTWVVNDLFFIWRQFEENGQSYQMDRGYIFEKQLNENTGGLFGKTLADYRKLEESAEIPLLFMTPTIVNDGRRLIISSIPSSYLTKPSGNFRLNNKTEIDGVEFTRMFRNQNAMNLKFSSALRMNASFPYVTPSVKLPSQPPMEIMDAGMRDNFGIQTSIRFLNVFKKWIQENTSGVIILQIRDTRKITEVQSRKNRSLVDKLVNPIGSFYLNWSEFQDFYNDNLIDYLSANFDQRFDIISFEYESNPEQPDVSLSWHLTTQEKLRMSDAVESKQFNDNLAYLKKLLDE